MLLRMAVLAAVVFGATFASWWVLERTNFPAFNTSFVLRALAVVTLAAVTLLTAAAGYAWVRARNASLRAASWLVLHLAPAALIIVALAVPLAATTLYLNGINIDQEFRTQFLSRMAVNPGWVDMAYLGMPSFYPGLWFITGGVISKFLGITAWVFYKPWAIATLAMGATILVPVWHRLTGRLALASALSCASAALMLWLAPEEPYAALVAVAFPAALVMAHRALDGGRLSLVGVIVYLGLSANLYTLYTGLAALSMVLLALILAIAHRSLWPLVRITVIGIASALLALPGWGPYLLALSTQPHGPTGLAQRFLPEIGTQFPLPFFELSAAAPLCLLGAVWMFLRRRTPPALSLLIGAIVCFGWTAASMLITVMGTTLLGFRVELLVGILFACAGVFAVSDWQLHRGHAVTAALTAAVSRDGSDATPSTASSTASATTAAQPASNQQRLTLALTVIAALGAVSFTTYIPTENEDSIDRAYTDTDGFGNRADRFPADSTRYYGAIDRTLQKHFDGQRNGKVILTDEKNFMAFYPYHGYQAITAHYANPLGQFGRRNEEIEKWSKLNSSAALLEAMDTAARKEGWQAPDAIILRGQLSTDSTAGSTDPAAQRGLAYLIADDIYPSQPNVRFRLVRFAPKLFATGWSLTQVGPYVVAVRTAPKPSHE